MPNFFKVCAASAITGKSVSLPIMIPIKGFSDIVEFLSEGVVGDDPGVDFHATCESRDAHFAAPGRASAARRREDAAIPLRRYLTGIAFLQTESCPLLCRRAE